MVSPHFDDAVLSCWSALERHRVAACVLTVFGGAPSPGLLYYWDARSPGARDSATRMKQRAAENRRALAPTRSRHIDLNLLEIQYAEVGGGRLSAEDLRPYLQHAAEVYGPAAVGTVVHPDHEAVRSVVQAVRPDASLYADQPYCHFPRDLELAGERDGFSRKVVVLDEAESRRKAEAIACYAGEIERMDGMVERLRRPEEEFRYEVVWNPLHARGV